MKKRKKHMVQPQKVCTNCKHNSGLACRNPPEEEQKQNYPKAFNCSNWLFTPAYIYSTKTHYGKFHTEA